MTGGENTGHENAAYAGPNDGWWWKKQDQKCGSWNLSTNVGRMLTLR